MNPISWRMSEYDVIKNVTQTPEPENQGRRQVTNFNLHFHKAITRWWTQKNSRKFTSSLWHQLCISLHTLQTDRGFPILAVASRLRYQSWPLFCRPERTKDCPGENNEWERSTFDHTGMEWEIWPLNWHHSQHSTWRSSYENTGCTMDAKSWNWRN